MAVDTKLGETKLGMGAANGAPNGTSNGATAPLVVAEGTKRTKRQSTLMRTATSLPKVEHSLDEFIARANQTLVDVENWGKADEAVKVEDEKRREQDAARWKQAEQQMREGEARETSLRRQLDGLQGKLAEAEARVAVALSASGTMPAFNLEQEKALEELRAQIEVANQRLKTSEAKSQELSRALDLAKTEVGARPAFAAGSSLDNNANDAAAEERIRLAEAKAAKALAAARAAAAGLTVSSADLAAIESGLVVTAPAERRMPWIPIMLAFAGGLGIMFLVWKFALSTPATTKTEPAKTEPAAEVKTEPVKTEPAPVQPEVKAPAEPPAPPQGKPTVTPIDENPTPQPAATEEPKKPTVTPIEPEVKQPEVKQPEVKQPEPEVKKQPPAVKKQPPAVKKQPPATKKPAIEDPFATDAPKKAPPPPAKKKPAGGDIVDPFAN